jgi:hypothetical protein
MFQRTRNLAACPANGGGSDLMSEANKPAFAIAFVELNPCGIALKTNLCKSVLSFRFIGFSFTIIQLFAFQYFMPFVLKFYICYLSVIQCIVFKNWRKVHREKPTIFFTIYPGCAALSLSKCSSTWNNRRALRAAHIPNY